MQLLGDTAPIGASTSAISYTKADDAEIARRRAAGEKWNTIGKALGRSPTAIRVHYRWICERVTVAQPATKTRKCLRCQVPFQSWGAGNRICEPCRAEADEAGAVDEIAVGSLACDERFSELEVGIIL